MDSALRDKSGVRYRVSAKRNKVVKYTVPYAGSTTFTSMSILSQLYCYIRLPSIGVGAKWYALSTSL